jgi:hypothetical protein
MTTNTRRNKSWMRNRNQLKNPKLFQVTMMRNTDGSFHLLGGGTRLLNRKNQHSASWVNVDTRDFAVELRRNKINSY